MKSRGARLALLVLFLVALGVTAFLFRQTEAARRDEVAAAQAFTAKARTAGRDVMELRAAQQAYVATGQGDDFWTARVTAALSRLRDGLGELRASSLSPDAQASIDAASGSLQDFVQMDTRARDYVRTDQKLLASDMIFSNGRELTDAAAGAIDKAVDSEVAARMAAADTFERRQGFALVAAAAAAGLVILLLLPSVQTELPAPSFLERTEPAPLRAASPVRPTVPTPIHTESEGWSAPRRVDAAPAEAGPMPAAAELSLSSGEPAAATPSATSEPGLVAAAPVPGLDFAAVASLCMELSRVDDTMALPPLLEQAASLLDAAGIILWIADPDARELNAVLAHGYPQHLVNRLGTISRTAENATAAAFRTGLMQTVCSDGISNGAIAAPLVTCGGCVGVMAAEVRGDSQKQDARLAAATIVAAQLASLVGPPAGRTNDAKVEAANA
jgi:CHASE3 domain sensor protein